MIVLPSKNKTVVREGFSAKCCFMAPKLNDLT